MKVFINKLRNVLALSILIVLFTNCSDFLDVNDNPNNPTTSTPSLTLPVAQADFASLNATSMNYLGNFMMANWAVPSNWSAMDILLTYNVTSTFYSTIFDTSYSRIFKNLTYIETYDDGAIDYTAYKVIAQAIKGFQYQYLVDLYGDIPYTEASLRTENLTPKYDDAATIYKDVIDKLTEAANTAMNMPEVYENPKGQDIIFGGDMTKWAQFINTVKLRMLIRLSNTGQDSYITGEIAKIDANKAGYIKADVVANPGYSSDEDKQNPFYGYVGKNSSDKPTDRNEYTVACNYAIDNLVLNSDMRYMRLYSKSKTGEYKGTEQRTILPGKGFTTNDLSHVGPGLLINSEQNQPILLLSEALFLQAEAMIRGYISGGETKAKEMYEKAIISSYQSLSVAKTAEDSKVAAETYFAQKVENIGWENSPNKIEAIIVQKSIALNGTNGIEAWIELTRTGFPDNVPVAPESKGKRPVRLLYPASELARNSKNVPEQTNSDAFTKYPFWK